MSDLEDVLARIVNLNPDERARWERLVRDLPYPDPPHPSRRAAVNRPLRIQVKESRRPWRGKLRKQWWSRIVAENGRVLYHSEGYLNEEDCIAAARLVATSEVVLELPPT